MSRVPMLATLINGLIKICNVIERARMPVRLFVPDANKAAYDEALNNIETACEILRSINYADSNPATTPIWGAKD